MSKQETSPPANSELDDGLPASEASLGKALAIIHHVLPWLDQAGRAREVQAALQKAASFVERARQFHAQELSLSASGAPGATADLVDSEIVVIIAAAVAALIGAPHRVVSVTSIEVPPHLNVWAYEGRTQLFMSHKVR